MAVVRILGVDPGTMVAGFGCLELRSGPREQRAGAPLALRAGNVLHHGGAHELLLVEVGVLKLGRRGDTVPERLCELLAAFAALLDRLQPYEVALEEAFTGKSVQSALRIGEARGVVLAEAARRGLVVHQFAPARIKKAVSGNGAAAKDTVAAMLRRQLPALAAAERDLPADATDALAVALTRAEQRRSPLALHERIADLP